MIATGKISKAAHYQTIQLPDGFEFPGDEVWIRKVESTGELILSPKRSDPSGRRLDVLFGLLDDAPLPDTFLAERQNPPELLRNPLNEWSE